MIDKDLIQLVNADIVFLAMNFEDDERMMRIRDHLVILRDSYLKTKEG